MAQSEPDYAEKKKKKGERTERGTTVPLESPKTTEEPIKLHRYFNSHLSKRGERILRCWCWVSGGRER